MFKRLFGRKKDSAEVVKEENTLEEKLGKTASANDRIRRKINEVQKKVEYQAKQNDTYREKAKALMMKNPKDPQIKVYLRKLKTGQSQLEKYQTMILQQESALQTIDDASFAAEMMDILSTTKSALDSAIGNTAEVMQELMEGIEERKNELSEVMDALFSNVPEVDVDDLMAELDAEIAEEAKAQANLPAANTTEPVAAPPKKNEDAELDAMLAEL